MTFTNEIAQVLDDDGDNLRVIPFVMYGAASRMDDLLYLEQIASNIRQRPERFPTCNVKSITSVGCRSEMHGARVQGDNHN